MTTQVSFRKRDITFFQSFSRIGIIFFFMASSIAVINIGLQPNMMKMQEGDISLTTVYAPFDFTYPGKIDEEKMKIARENAMQAVQPVFTVDHSAYEMTSKDIVALFENLRSVQPIEVESIRDKVEMIKPSFSLNLSDATLATLLSETDLVGFKKVFDDVLEEMYRSYIMNPKAKEELLQEKRKDCVILETKPAEERVVAIDGIPTTDAIGGYEERIGELAEQDNRKKQAVLEVLGTVLRPNIVPDQEQTKARTEEASRSVPLIRERLKTKKNEIIIRKGQRVSREHIVQLNQLSTIQGVSDFGSYLAGITLLLAILTAIFALFIRFKEPGINRNPKNLFIIALIGIIGIALAKATSALPFSSYVMPFASITMLVAILVSPTAAIASGVLLSVVVAVILGGRMEVVLVTMVGGLIGIFAVRNLRRRFQIVIAGLEVGCVSSLAIITMGLLNNLKTSTFLSESLWGIASGMISAFIVMGLLPIFEHLFKITTNTALLELSDLNHPLLKELTLKAPGTYHHSLLVGNLAEAACKAIGANALLARIGSYYHDIGKMDKAEYFSENQSSLKSKHETLAPTMSSLIIGNHVKVGVELARKYKLYQPIIDLIQQHHGTSLMYFFYKKALDTVNGQDRLEEEEYRYPGPRPQTKEAAVILLADAVEAASRTLGEPTPGKIKNLVRRIINNKFIDKQLDESDLTLNDLYKISESFVRILIAAFHVRTEYPAQQEEGRLVVRSPDNKPE